MSVKDRRTAPQILTWVPTDYTEGEFKQAFDERQYRFLKRKQMPLIERVPDKEAISCECRYFHAPVVTSGYHRVGHLYHAGEYTNGH